MQTNPQTKPIIEFSEDNIDAQSQVDREVGLAQFGVSVPEKQLKLKSIQEPKHSKGLTEQEYLIMKQHHSIIFTFEVSLEIINLLRAPVIDEHIFNPIYMQQLLNGVQKYCELPTYDKQFMLIHLLLAQIDNLGDFALVVGEENVKDIADVWNCTNAINPHCIVANLIQIKGHEEYAKRKSQKHINDQINANLNKQKLRVDIIKTPGIYIYNNGVIKLSSNLIEVCLKRKGHLDIYFAQFIYNKLPLTAIHRCVQDEVGQDILSENYAAIYSRFVEEYDHMSQLDFQEWYQKIVEEIISKKYNSESLMTLLNSNIKHPNIEKALIEAVGFKLEGREEEIQENIKMLLMFYDNCDWQLKGPFRPHIAQCFQKFTINYLIQHQSKHSSLVICLKAPCLNPYYADEVFTWHSPKVREYSYEEEKYQWVQQNLGFFTKCGFYDWKLFELTKERKANVHKVIDNSEFKKNDPNILKQNQILAKQVKGRVIVHPANTRTLQIHEIYVDALIPHSINAKSQAFTAAIKVLQQCHASGINCVYLLGIFQRDTGEFSQGFKRLHASPTALVSRKNVCKMLGGAEQFKKFIKKAKELKVKVIVDCTTRISSSRMEKPYEKYLLQYVDENGRKNYFYGTEGRGLRYEESAMLNYRNKQAWDLFLEEIITVINQYAVDGIYMDNGFSWPNIFDIDMEEMLRTTINGSRYYSNQQIINGTVVLRNKQVGFWASEASFTYSNPFIYHICKSLWSIFPDLLIISEGNESKQTDRRILPVMFSGPVPRLFKLPKALAMVIGKSLSNSGSVRDCKEKSITQLSKWYQDFSLMLPKNYIIIQSTTSHAWPNLAFLFKQATWAVIDLYFFLPHIPMTFQDQEQGAAYRSKSLNLYSGSVEQGKKNQDSSPSKNKIKTSSSFYNSMDEANSSNVTLGSENISLCNPNQKAILQENFRIAVGPQFGFNLSEIHKHYQHRRKIRQQWPLLSSGPMIILPVEHTHGTHSNILSFAKWNQKEILIVSINFNNCQISMRLNLTKLKGLFSMHQHSYMVLRLQNLFDSQGFKEQYYTAAQFLNSRIETLMGPFKSSIWRLTLQSRQLLPKALLCSQRRVFQCINSTPPKWIYSSIFTNELSNLVQKCEGIKSFVNCLNYLFKNFIDPLKLDFSLVISKTYEFKINKAKIQKIFGIFKIIQDNPKLQSTLQLHIKNMLEGNILGPIAFVTPEIGKWSTVGGLGVMLDELSKELAKIGQQVYIITPYYEYNKKNQTDYLKRDGFTYDRNIKTYAAHFQMQFGIHRGAYKKVNYIWFHNPELFSRPYEGQSAFYVSKQLVFFALATLETCCQLKIFPSIIATNDWMCGFVSAYVKCNKYKEVFNGTKFMHICHNLDPLYQGRLYPKVEEGSLQWLIQLPTEWYTYHQSNKVIINPSKCALMTCDNWGTVSNSYKFDLLKGSPLSNVLWRHPQPFAFPNGVRKQQRLSIINAKTPGNHLDSKKLLQQKYFGMDELQNDIPIFSFIGRVTKQKGVHLILDAVEAILGEYNFKVQFIVGGFSDSKEDYGKYCAGRMNYLNSKYPKNFWSNPSAFFIDGALVNIGSDFGLMPSLFQPGGIVQHEFFSGSTPVVAFRTGGLKDTVFEYNYKTGKGNGFNFMAYEIEDFKNCLKRAITAYKDKKTYEKLRENAFESVIEEEDVARGWNTEFYRLQNKIYIDWNKVNEKIEFQNNNEEKSNEDTIQFIEGDFWKPQWQIYSSFKGVLKYCSRLKVKSHTFKFNTDKIPRPKEVLISGSWDDWKKTTKMNFDKVDRNWSLTMKLKPGMYHYKYMVDEEWTLNKQDEIEEDQSSNNNHIISID